MTCGQCRRDNAPNRRYCGGCGHDLIVPCGVCGFANARDDRFCGGCRLEVGEAPRSESQLVPVVSALPDELAGLFAAPAVVPTQRLPDANIGQDDLDRLFGESP